MQERMKQVRKALGLKQREIAEKLGVSIGTYGGWETGVPIPDARIYQICHEFSINEEWFRTGNGTMFVNAAKEVERLSDEELIRELNERGYATYLTPMDGWQTVEFVGAGF